MVTLRQTTRFWVEVVICKFDGSIEIGNYRDARLVSAAVGPDFRTAMIRTTISGLEKDEPADERC